MAAGWVKSLHCKSKAFDDVVHHHHHHISLLPTATSCKKGVKDVVETVRKERPRKTKQPQQRPQPPPPPPPRRSTSTTKRSVSRKPECIPNQISVISAQSSASTRHSRASSDTVFPALTELPEGHPSRNVVEIIFHTSWSPKAFSGRIEMVFKVQNLPRTVSRFEEYRETVKSQATSGDSQHEMVGGCEDHSRCVADGNEVMRFYCLPPSGGAYDTTSGGAWMNGAGKGAIVCTFSGSGEAHENAGGGKGRRAMLVCRVIAGRICEQLGFHSLSEGRIGFDSVSGNNGELLVFDSRAVLPCFLIIYNL